MRLGEIKRPRGANRQAKRLGQGVGSGTGKTSGRGHKGQRSRSGSKRGRRTGFEGGQMPLYRRLPKIGFSNHDFKLSYQVVNVGALEKLAGETEIGPEQLHRAGLIGKLGDPVKILGEGELTRSLVIKAHRFSKTALDKIGRAGGRAEVV